jgi:hypothetical protein
MFDQGMKQIALFRKEDVKFYDTLPLLKKRKAIYVHVGSPEVPLSSHPYCKPS